MNVTTDQTARDATATDCESDLEELLSESPADAERRASNRLSLSEGDALVLYGAGNLGRHVLARLRTLNIEPVAFADDTPSKQGSIIDGLRVLTPREVIERFGARSLFAVTILNPAASFLKVKRGLEILTEDLSKSLTRVRVVSFLELAWKYPESFLPHYQFELPRDVLTNVNEIRRAFRLFADEESRRQFVAHLRFRLRLDFDALPRANFGDYFPEDVVPELSDKATFIDCGAFDGDTVRRFVERQRGRFREIHAFEPDAENFRRLHEYAAGLDAHERVHLYRAAVGARRGRARFDSSGDMASTLSDAGVEEVDVLPVQEVVSFNDDGGPLFLKFDVEGAEADALEGAARLIERARAFVAVCVYHRPDDLWELPLKLAALAPAHRLFLRTQGEDGMDVVCYAVPPREDS
jgi:FkbM family methyltransferase